jgi:endo-1,4-beta-D-glucanase Y
MVSRLLGYILLICAAVLVFVVIYRNSQKSEVPLTFAPTQLLDATWVAYKKVYIEAGTFRTLDKQRNDITTSEGQSYTMLRSVWMGDKQVFDGAWKWTKSYLHRDSDHLFSWLWGERDNGSYGVLTSQSGQNTASDADENIALALIFGYARWQDPQYLRDARDILTDIWNKEVIVIRGVPYSAADDLEKNSLSHTAVVNPSYLEPAAYKVFATVDTTHDWNALADSSYVLLQKSMAAQLDAGASSNLPPNWVGIDKTTGALVPLGGSNDTNFGYDAMRVPWNIALDWQWFGDSRAKELLERMSFLSEQWDAHKSLASVYSHAGAVAAASEAPAIYGGVLGYFAVAEPAQAQEVYQEKLVFLYEPGANDWKQRLSYYDDNWVWFGIGLYNNLLPNLAKDIPKEALTR